MEIISDISGYEDQLEAFNKKHWPKRKGSYIELLNWRINENPCSADKTASMLIALENELVIGQLILIHSVAIMNGHETPILWGTDLMVDKAYRGSPAGVTLTRRAMKMGHHFGSGFSPESEKLHRVLGETQIAEIKKYVGHTSVKSLLLSNGDKSLQAQGLAFSKVPATSIINKEKGNYNGPIRNNDFFKWRYAFPDQDFIAYSTADHTCYFVARKVKIKSIPTLKLIDYRFTNSKEFSSILVVFDQLAGRLKLPAKLVTASLPVLHDLIESHSYSYQRSSPVLTNWKDELASPMLVTPADSDADFWA